MTSAVTPTTLDEGAATYSRPIGGYHGDRQADGYGKNSQLSTPDVSIQKTALTEAPAAAGIANTL